MVKCLPAMQETWVWSLGWEDPLKEMATHSSTLAWKIPWTEEPGRLQSMGLQRVKTQLSDFTFTFCVFLPPLLNIFCFCSVHTISVLYWAHLCMKCSLVISNFLEVISNLSHCIVFLYFFALIAEEGFLISPWCSLELCIQMGIYFLFSLAFNFSS